MMHPRCFSRPALAGVVALLLASPVSAAGVKLKSVEFPVAATAVKGPKAAPSAAPLSQRVVFVFSGKPKLGPEVAEGLRIRVADGNVAGQVAGTPALGTYDVAGKRVVFTPRLPTGALDGFGPASDIGADGSRPGLLPETVYEIDVDPDNVAAVKNLKKVSGALTLPILFTTVAEAPPAAALETYFSNFSDAPPKLEKKGGVSPKDGSSGIHPNLFTDPAGLFISIKPSKRPPFRLRFKAPITPDGAAIADALRVRATEDPAGAPVDVALAVTAVLTKNTVDGAEVMIFPTGVLPLGHELEFELADALESIAGVTAGAGAPATFDSVATWAVADSGGAPVLDAFLEDFDTTAHQDSSIALEGLTLAAWDAGDSNHLRATSAFGGDDALGRFEAPPWEDIIFLDTDYQTFPLFNGATPQANPGTVVTDGVFHFSSFYLPPGVTIRARGSNPLVITCTEECVIEGKIVVSGSPGASDNIFDSGLSAVPGGSAGAGGGKGGDGHPVVAPPPGVPLVAMQTPAFGGSGQGPGGEGVGGGGGQSGCSMPWSPFASGLCSNYSPFGDGSRGSGGGGGSFGVFLPDAPEDPGVAISGRAGAIGAGDHLPVPFDAFAPMPPVPEVYDAQPGNPTNAVAMASPNLTFAQAVAAGLVWDAGSPFITSTTWAQTRRVLLGGGAGPAVFADVDPENDFIGPGGEVPMIHGGQGGGAGGSRTEGLDQSCKQQIFVGAGLPFTVLDARGGAGGGAGGAVLIQAIGEIELRGPEACIEAIGGNGGGGEQVGESGRGGAGGGGSGGAVVLQSATNVLLDDAALPALAIDVSGGCPANAVNLASNSNYGTPGADSNVLQFADGGPGGPGLVQVAIPIGAPDRVDETRVGARVYPSVLQMNGSWTLHNTCFETGRALIPALVPPEKTPADLSSISAARSTWIDLGAVTSDFRPPVPTSAGPFAGPLFGVPGQPPIFRGTDPLTGLVPTDAAGNVELLATSDVEVDAPDLLKPDFIPNGPTWFQTVQVLFQGADEDAALPGTPDLATATEWVTDATLLNGREFMRWEIRFDMASNPGVPLDFSTPRPQVNRLRVPFRF